MRKKIIFITGLVALGFVVFNNVVQTMESIKNNGYYLTGLLIAIIVTLLYGGINVK